MSHDPHLQTAHDVRLLWGRRGAKAGAARGDTVVIIDVLSFSTLVTCAVARGVLIHPWTTHEETARVARALGAVVAARREDAARLGGVSLSPTSLTTLDPGSRVIMPSPNGATCTRLATAGAHATLIGCARNAGAIARALRGAERATLVACGERWPDGTLRPALEDWLGAGLILAQMTPDASWSAEALAARAMASALGDLHEVLRGSASGQELVERGYPHDVIFAAKLDADDVVPRWDDPWFVS